MSFCILNVAALNGPANNPLEGHSRHQFGREPAIEHFTVAAVAKNQPVFSESDNRLEKLLAKSSSIVIARAALTTAIAEYPGKTITLRQGVRVIDESEQREC